MNEPTFPHDLNAFCATMARILAERGSMVALSALAYGDVSASHSFQRGWMGDAAPLTSAWRFEVRLAPEVYARLDGLERSDVERELGELGSEVFGSLDGHCASTWSIAPAIERSEGWQQAARATLEGHGAIHNQGRVRSDNPPMLQHDGLFFRSEPEKWFYLACKEAQLVCAPLPVFLRPGKTNPFRIEPDMLVLRQRRVIQFELDGNAFHRETPVEAQDRVDAMIREGVTVHRIRSVDCATLEKARAALRKAFVDLNLSLPSGG